MKHRWIVVAVILVLAALVPAGMAWFAWRAVRKPADVVKQAVKREEVMLDHGAIVTRIQDLARLETASMRVMHVSTVRQSHGIVPQALAGDEITFVAVGDVIAGVDLQRLRPDDVIVEGRSVTVRLPPSEILVTRLDNEQSHIANRSTGVLRRSDPGLESRLRASSEKGIRKTSLDRGILELADRNAEQRVVGLLQALRFESVRIIRPARPAADQG